MSKLLKAPRRLEAHNSRAVAGQVEHLLYILHMQGWRVNKADMKCINIGTQTNLIPFLVILTNITRCLQLSHVVSSNSQSISWCTLLPIHEGGRNQMKACMNYQVIHFIHLIRKQLAPMNKTKSILNVTSYDLCIQINEETS
jgi:hypothetical protein